MAFKRRSDNNGSYNNGNRQGSGNYNSGRRTGSSSSQNKGYSARRSQGNGGNYVRRQQQDNRVWLKFAVVFQNEPSANNSESNIRLMIAPGDLVLSDGTELTEEQFNYLVTQALVINRQKAQANTYLLDNGDVRGVMSVEVTDLVQTLADFDEEPKKVKTTKTKVKRTPMPEPVEEEDDEDNEDDDSDIF